IPYFFTLGCVSIGDSNGQARLSSTMFLAETLNITRGAHSLKFGGECRSVKDNNLDNFLSRDSLSMDNGDFGYDSYNFYPASPTYPTFQNLIWGATGAVANAIEYQFF